MSTAMKSDSRTIFISYTDVNKSVTLCEFCLKEVPSGNFFTHETHCKSLSSTAVSVTQTAVKSTSTSGKKKKSQKKKMEPSEDDLDTLLTEMTLADSKCGFERCRKSTNLIGMRCMFCRKRFCVGHSVAEVHGCGEQARRHAKRDLRQPGG